MLESSSRAWPEGVLIVDDRASSPTAVDDDVLRLFDRVGPHLVRYARSFGLDHDEAEDVVQEAFLALFRHLRLGRPRDNLRAWLFRVTHNLALKERRGLRRRSAWVAYDDQLLAACPADEPDPEARAVRDERWRRIMSVIGALPARDRQCLHLRVAGLTYRDIATALGISLGSVAKSLARITSRVVRSDA